MNNILIFEQRKESDGIIWDVVALELERFGDHVEIEMSNFSDDIHINLSVEQVKKMTEFLGGFVGMVSA